MTKKRDIKNKSKIIHKLNEVYFPEEGEGFTLRIAREDDMDDIKRLYFIVYGGKYTLPEINNTDKMKWALNDPNYIWLLWEKDGDIVGSVVFLVDPKNRLGKSFAGVVLPEFRGFKLMKIAMKRGIDYVFEEKDLCDLIYGVVRTFVTKSFHEDLADLGFIDMGIFPNVRKVSKYETHGLKVVFRDKALMNRRKTPILIPQSQEIYEIVRSRLNLEEADVVKYNYETPLKFEKFEFYVEKSPDIEWEYYKKRDSGELLLSFYPFHYPEIKLYTKDKKTEVYIHFEERDGHGDLMGLHTDQPEKMTDILEAVSEYAESIGIKYMELLINAYNIKNQKMAFEADFIPCAYFPAMMMDRENRGTDYIVTCRTFVPLDFKGLKLTEGTRAYTRAYYKIRTTKLWEDLEHA